MTTPSQGQIEGNPTVQKMASKKRRKQGSPSLRGDIGVCKVINVNYEEFFVTLRVILGDDFINERIPVPLVFPGAGTRHFLGAMPEVGDYCICGWMPQDSGGAGVNNSKGTQTPVILGWIPRGAWLGHDWFFTSPLTEEDQPMTQKKKDELLGVYNQHRHKRMHLRPGDICASSSKGSDILLNEGVYITNRRANEIRLRDQDQAFVVRSQQQFHIMSGARVYAGLVQRDGKYLQGGVDADAGLLTRDLIDSEGNPIKLRSNLFSRGSRTFAPSIYDIPMSESLNPDMIADKFGLTATSPVVYGGKPMYRICIDSDGKLENAFTENLPTFTEHRLEIEHYSDLTLPVTEQTEGVGIDKLPPLVEVVHGTVVGNNIKDDDYGDLLTATIFPSPSISILKEGGLGNHIASLHKVNPVMRGFKPTFCAVMKDGRVKVSIGGKQETDSFDFRVEGNTRLDFNGGLEFLSNKPLKFKATGETDEKNVGLDLSSEKGAVVISASGNMVDAGHASTEQVNPTGEGDNPQVSPSILITSKDTHLEGTETLEFKSGGKATIQATNKVSISTDTSLEITCPSGIIKQNSQQVEQTVVGKAERSFSGPLSGASGIPSTQKLPLRKTTFSTAAPNVNRQDVDEYVYQKGSRKEDFWVGNHKTTMKVGNMVYDLTAGDHTIQAAARQNTQTIGKIGYSLGVKVGGVTLSATSGPMTLTGNTSMSINTTGVAVIAAAGGITLSSPGGAVGGIIASSSLSPLNGQPFGSPLNGIQGSKKHFLA